MDVNNLYLMDMARYNNKAPFYIKMLLFTFRRASIDGGFVWKFLLKILADYKHLEILPTTKIGGGLYIGHCSSITINPKSKIGYNVIYIKE